jgi:hypothetical protein
VLAQVCICARDLLVVVCMVVWGQACDALGGPPTQPLLQDVADNVCWGHWGQVPQMVVISLQAAAACTVLPACRCAAAQSDAIVLLCTVGIVPTCPPYIALAAVSPDAQGVL